MRRFIPPVALLAGMLLLIAFSVFVNSLTDQGDPFGGYCFTIIDHRGEAHPSEEEPKFIPGVEAYYETPEELGIVMAPLVIRISTACMEETGELDEDR